MYDAQKHHRRSIRLKGYDYAQPGAYFITLVAWQRQNRFGEIANGEVQLNQAGRIIHDSWQRLPAFFPVRNEVWVVMPNHFHGLLWIDGEGKGEASAPSELLTSDINPADASPLRPNGTKPDSLAAIIQNFKSITTHRIHQLGVSPGMPVWQHNYYEHIVRNDKELERMRAYIQSNPLNWHDDQEYSP